ncbi:MAG: hypothetical protein GSR72_03310 [Desulfurococcales archaeon]|nr:hypothetical protein [Desulfurococcales archaeon]MEB3788905.1 hypothetical protein [Desulfurococcales archaeon]
MKSKKSRKDAHVPGDNEIKTGLTRPIKEQSSIGIKGNKHIFWYTSSRNPKRKQ